jgi:hypothetical protein
MSLIPLLVMALIAEAVWETLKMTWQQGKFSWDKIGALVVGLLVSFGAQLDILAMAGVTLVIPYLGYVLSGILISRGSNFVHDLWTAISNLKIFSAARAATATVEINKIVNGKPVEPVPVVSPTTIKTPVIPAPPIVRPAVIKVIKSGSTTNKPV